MAFTICGIDYSMTSPSICIHRGDVWDHNQCEFHYLTPRKKEVVRNQKGLFGADYPDYYSDNHRYDNLSKWALEIVRQAQPDAIFLEGYAFGAVGRVFQIAENTGILKFKLWQEGFDVSTFTPNEIKKDATGKGNANKELMCDAFLQETGLDIRAQLGLRETAWNPISDIVDAYYIAKLGFNRKHGLSVPTPKKPKKKKERKEVKTP